MHRDKLSWCRSRSAACVSPSRPRRLQRILFAGTRARKRSIHTNTKHNRAGFSCGHAASTPLRSFSDDSSRKSDGNQCMRQTAKPSVYVAPLKANCLCAGITHFPTWNRDSRVGKHFLAGGHFDSFRLIERVWRKI